MDIEKASLNTEQLMTVRLHCYQKATHWQMWEQSREHLSIHWESWKRSIVWYAKHYTHKMDVWPLRSGDGGKVCCLWFACNSGVYRVLFNAAISVHFYTLERVKINAFFWKKLADFHHFSGRFVIFNIGVNKLDIRKINQKKLTSFRYFLHFFVIFDLDKIKGF